MIVITANHYVIDAVGGLVILAIGWVIANRFTPAGRGRPYGRRAPQPTADARYVVAAHQRRTTSWTA